MKNVTQLSKQAHEQSFIDKLTPQMRRAMVESMTDMDLSILKHDWNKWARPMQLAPGHPLSSNADRVEWLVWLLMTGRGFGKTRAGAEFIRAEVEAGRAQRIALIGATASDVRDVMIEGDAGILRISPSWNRPSYEPSKRRLTWPNGAVATAYSAEEPNRLRGPQHDLSWCDEIAAWKYLRETWDNLRFGLRKGEHPRICATTTPRPLTFLKELIDDEDTVLSRGTTFDNAHNLAAIFVKHIRSAYEGTNIGEQELKGILLDKVEGALWELSMILRSEFSAAQVLENDELRSEFDRIIVSMDPSGSGKETADKMGILVQGKREGRGYVLEDLSRRCSPLEACKTASTAYWRWNADRVIGEVNNGADWIRTTLSLVDPLVRFKDVRATLGKTRRAQPVVAMYEQGRMFHCGVFEDLEYQMCNFEEKAWRSEGKSPDNMDAMVWGFTELFLKRQGEFFTL